MLCVLGLLIDLKVPAAHPLSAVRQESGEHEIDSFYLIFQLRELRAAQPRTCAFGGLCVCAWPPMLMCVLVSLELLCRGLLSCTAPPCGRL